MVTRASLDLEHPEKRNPEKKVNPVVSHLTRTTSMPCEGLQMASRVSAYPSSVPWGESDLAPKVCRQGE